MSGFITIRGREIPESWVWAVGGVIGVLIGLPFYPILLLGLASGGFPSIPVVSILVGVSISLLLWVARRVDRPVSARAWAAITWLLVTGWGWFAAISAIGQLLSDGPVTEIPTVLLTVAGIVFSVATIAGSAFVAVASYEVGRHLIAVRNEPVLET